MNKKSALPFDFVRSPRADEEDSLGMNMISSVPQGKEKVVIVYKVLLAMMVSSLQILSGIHCETD